MFPQAKKITVEMYVSSEPFMGKIHVEAVLQIEESMLFNNLKEIELPFSETI